MIRGSLPTNNLERFIPDYTGSKKHAEELARRIRRYWFERGEPNYDIKVIKQDLGTKEEPRPIYIIRSNIQLVFKD